MGTLFKFGELHFQGQTHCKQQNALVFAESLVRDTTQKWEGVDRSLQKHKIVQLFRGNIRKKRFRGVP